MNGSCGGRRSVRCRRSAHDMAREYRVLSRLWEACEPAPRAILLCEDKEIIGAPFFVMQRRSGFVVPNRRPLDAGHHANPATFRAMSEGFIDALADLHSVDYKSSAWRPRASRRFRTPADYRLDGSLGKGQDQRSAADEPARRVVPRTYAPAAAGACCITISFCTTSCSRPDNSGKVVGVFDWEMSTVGDPMIDLGTSFNYWREAGPTRRKCSKWLRVMRIPRAPGFMTRDELAERYARRCGRDLTYVDYYRAWGLWKTATVLQQIYVASCAARPPIRASSGWERIRRSWRARPPASWPGTASIA